MCVFICVLKLFSPSAVIIGPNYTAYSDPFSLATEASGRQACTLMGMQGGEEHITRFSCVFCQYSLYP